MQYFLLGALILVLLVVAASAAANANPARLADMVRKTGGVLALLLAAFFAVTGRFPLALPLAAFGFMLLGRNILAGMGWPGNARKSPGQDSRVRTGWVEMTLDHDSGDMDGEVVKGRFAGRAIGSLSLDELLALLGECRRYDPQAASLVEAYLDRAHPGWRDLAGAGDGAQGQGAHASPGRMPHDEALEVLGLKAGAARKDIRAAHRNLMKKLHPDHGGSGYLAAKINEAKDVLLGQ